VTIELPNKTFMIWESPTAMKVTGYCERERSNLINIRFKPEIAS